MGEERKGADPLVAAMGAVVEGVTFFELGHRAAADTRVKVAFGDLGKRKRDQLARLEALAGPGAAQASPRPGFFPVDAVSKVECYVCGHSLETAAMPDVCPRCGAARYSFEKEIVLSKAWEIAGAGARRSADLFRRLSADAEGPSKVLLEGLAKEEDGLAARAEQQVAELRT